MGKTYEGTRRARQYLFSGYTVYTTWRLNLPDYYDEREHIGPVLRNLFLFRREFFRFDLKNNWHWLDLRTFEDEKTKVVNTRKLADYVASLTDCILFLDEGQDIFDSHERATKSARQSITRTRHMHKTLIIISQRASAVDVNARANVTFFYKCVKVWDGWPRAYFRVYRTDEIDEQSSNPLWVRHNSIGEVTWQAPVWHSGWARRAIYDAYDSWYLRREMIRSQDIKVDAYSLTFGDKLRALVGLFKRRSPAPEEDIPALSPVSEKVHVLPSPSDTMVT